MSAKKKKFPYSWEEAIEILRRDPQHAQLIHDSYLTENLEENAKRFSESAEFSEAMNLLGRYLPQGARILDIPGGNGIATYAFASRGFRVTAVEPNPSAIAGREAIQTVLKHAGLAAEIIDAFGEALPLDEGSFDLVYVRQGLHHAKDLERMLAEFARVLKPGGILLACREHVVDDYHRGLQRFLDSQPDHQLYGGEHAFMLKDYRQAIRNAALSLIGEWGPYDTLINMHPNSPETLCQKILDTLPGKLLGKLLPRRMVCWLGMRMLRLRKQPGRLYSFLAIKNPPEHSHA